jgi:hypothetical protein
LVFLSRSLCFVFMFRSVCGYWLLGVIVIFVVGGGCCCHCCCWWWLLWLAAAAAVVFVVVVVDVVVVVVVAFVCVCHGLNVSFPFFTLLNESKCVHRRILDDSSICDCV